MVTGFGSTVADILMVSDKFGLNQKNLVELQTVQVGGVIPTALIVLSRLGVETDLRTVIGDDEFSRTLLNKFIREKIKTNNLLKLKQSKTPLAIVILNSLNGERTNFYSIGKFGKTELRNLNLSIDSRTKLVLIDGHNIKSSLEIVRNARKISATVMLDLGNPKRDIEILMKESDVIVVPGAYWHSVWKGEDPEKIIRKLILQYEKDIYLTMENEGCLVGCDNVIFHQKSFPVEAIDTNGAGDIFFGSLAYGYYQDWDLKRKVRFASAAAALSCTIIGKDRKIAELTDVNSFLELNK